MPLGWAACECQPASKDRDGAHAAARARDDVPDSVEPTRVVANAKAGGTGARAVIRGNRRFRRVTCESTVGYAMMVRPRYRIWASLGTLRTGSLVVQNRSARLESPVGSYRRRGEPSRPHVPDMPNP